MFEGMYGSVIFMMFLSCSYENSIETCTDANDNLENIWMMFQQSVEEPASLGLATAIVSIFIHFRLFSFYMFNEMVGE